MLSRGSIIPVGREPRLLETEWSPASFDMVFRAERGGDFAVVGAGAAFGFETVALPDSRDATVSNPVGSSCSSRPARPPVPTTPPPRSAPAPRLDNCLSPSSFFIDAKRRLKQPGLFLVVLLCRTTLRLACSR